MGILIKKGKKLHEHILFFIKFIKQILHEIYIFQKNLCPMLPAPPVYGNLGNGSPKFKLLGQNMNRLSLKRGRSIVWSFCFSFLP